ncbi:MULTISPECIES: hypothetical protein [unclassified Streptomyces]|uniref:hypothetical protein n=1 Tax=unclassified Streptomyces TaxID=2593676 RepID=UPI0033343053
MTTKPREEAPHHRSLYCVKRFGCLRPECRERCNEYTRRRYRRVAYGTWQPFVDAAPVRAHINSLRAAGAGTGSIAQAAGVTAATIARILYSRQGQNATVRTQSAAAILAVTPDSCSTPDSARIDATGTRRRIQALVAAGWSFTALESEMGIHNRHLGALARTTHVSAGIARKVRGAYKRLVQTTPERAGVSSQAQALARRVARREGWHGPLAWDDIDDPAARPEVTAPYTPPAGNGRDSMRMVDLEHLLSLGESEASIAKQVGASEAYIHDLAVLIRNRKAVAA